MTIRYLFVFLLCSTWLQAQVSQINIPRVDLMPSQPNPYNLRDWKQVALRYDSFVYNEGNTGQYLPLVQVQPAGVNYPQYPAFGLHTYVGTNSPNGNEAINVLPSLVGASLCGADKSAQFGRDWVRMSQDFFSLSNNGAGIYLNSKGGGSGADWWYDLMPNVYFYQLCALYPPAPGSTAQMQMLSVADKFLASVQALGGSETPWQKGNFDYRAFNFQTMQPNASGVHEPEAAGAYAWVLYQAYHLTGAEKYRKGAEWSLEFLQDWTTNPSYELQLPYGTLTAARMNAELGTRYDIEKLVNWSFNRGPLRGWGTIVGNWGGFDCSGLVGEANDAGNDYAFQLNGVQQAAALAPMVRYDKRFARAIGKWMLNLANATRLFYPGFLPANYQDASAWSNANDPDRIMGYEAMKQKYQNISPYSTGDALGGGWAATNLSLYSTGSIGYLGSILEKTSVDKILKIDVLKTDFFHQQAYPTYLLYNPYGNTQQITFDAGALPSDLYDAITETFFLENVSGQVNVQIPANGVVLVSVCPAGGQRTFERNLLKVNGVVVDFNQTQQTYQRPPRIQSVAASLPVVEKNKTLNVYSQVQAGDDSNLSYFWSANAGMLNAAGPGGTWTAPDQTGPVALQLMVLDGNGQSDTAVLELSVVEEINQAPVVLSIQKNQQFVAPGGAVQCTCVATDANNDVLSYQWSFSGGTFSSSGNTAQWTAPGNTGIITAQVTVTDEEGLSAVYQTQILVWNFSAASGNLVAYYNFSGNANDLTANQLNGIPFSTAYVNDVFGASGKALYCNGVNSRVTVAAQPVLNFQDGITVSAWLQAADLPNKESFPISHGSWQNRWKISFTPEKKLRWTVNTLNSTSDLDSEWAFQTDSFYHVTATYDGQLMAMYINGQLHSFRFLTGKIRTTNVALLLGQMLPGNTEYNFKGTLDEVRIYNYALMPDAVASLFEQATTSAFQPLKAVPELELSPNPAREVLWVKWPQGDCSAHARYLIYDAQGSKKMEILVQNQGKEQSIPIADLPPGAYILLLLDGKVIGQGKFLVTR